MNKVLHTNKPLSALVNLDDTLYAVSITPDVLVVRDIIKQTTLEVDSEECIKVIKFYMDSVPTCTCSIGEQELTDLLTKQRNDIKRLISNAL